MLAHCRVERWVGELRPWQSKKRSRPRSPRSPQPRCSWRIHWADPLDGRLAAFSEKHSGILKKFFWHFQTLINRLVFLLSQFDWLCRNTVVLEWTKIGKPLTDWKMFDSTQNTVEWWTAPLRPKQDGAHHSFWCCVVFPRRQMPRTWHRLLPLLLQLTVSKTWSHNEQILQRGTVYFRLFCLWKEA